MRPFLLPHVCKLRQSLVPFAVVRVLSLLPPERRLKCPSAALLPPRASRLSRGRILDLHRTLDTDCYSCLLAAITRYPDTSTSQQLSIVQPSLLAPAGQPPSQLQTSPKASAAPPLAAASTLRQTTKRAAVETAPSLSASVYPSLGRSFPTHCACGGLI